MNPYEILGLKPTEATPSAVERAHRALRGAAHPDRNGGSEEKMTEINQARDILLSPERKQRFDEIGSTSSGQLSVEEQAMIVLGNILATALDSAPEGISHARILAAVAQEIEKGRQKALEAQRKMPKLIKRLEGLLKAIRCSDFLRSAFEARLTRLERQKSEVNQQIELGNFMIKAMKSVEFLRSRRA